MIFDLHLVIIILIFSNIVLVHSELITMTIVGSALMGGFFGWDSIKSNTVCRYMECCNDNYIPYDLEAYLNKIIQLSLQLTVLKQSFQQRIFGQPLVYELVNILRAHKEALKNEQKRNKKALVISLHGWSGVGKNYATNMIAEALYKNGMKSSFVKIFMGKKDFSCNHAQKAQDELLSKIKDVVKKCPTSLIVFDEIHEMCPSILDVIKPLLDHHHAVDGVDYRDSIFIFISNIGGKEIASHLLELYNNGVKRNDIKFQDFEPLIRRTAYKTGGFDKSSIIAQHLIDHYIPFLPLELHHVETCAIAEFRAHGVYNPTKEMMEDALSVISYGPSDDQRVFANNGCKRFSQQIPYVIQKHKPKDEL